MRQCVPLFPLGVDNKRVIIPFSPKSSSEGQHGMAGLGWNTKTVDPPSHINAPYFHVRKQVLELGHDGPFSDPHSSYPCSDLIHILENRV